MPRCSTPSSRTLHMPDRQVNRSNEAHDAYHEHVHPTKHCRRPWSAAGLTLGALGSLVFLNFFSTPPFAPLAAFLGAMLILMNVARDQRSECVIMTSCRQGRRCIRKTGDRRSVCRSPFKTGVERVGQESGRSRLHPFAILMRSDDNRTCPSAGGFHDDIQCLILHIVTRIYKDC